MLSKRSLFNPPCCCWCVVVLLLCVVGRRAENQGGFDPAAVGMSEKEAANIALAFGQVN